MPDALTLLETRRSVSARNMTEPGPSAAELDRMLAIAARVPDHGKLAPWRFVVFEGAARARAGEGLAAIMTRRGDPAEKVEQTRTALLRAPVVVAVVSTAAEHPKIPVWEQQMSAAAATMNLLHAAHASGYVANWLTDWFAFDGEAKALLGVKETEQVVGFVYIGSAKEPPAERPRPELSRIVTRWAG
jgi:nitroreductase